MSVHKESLVIVVQASPTDDQRARLAQAAPDADIRIVERPTDVAAHAQEAEVIAGDVDAATLAAARRLRWVHSWLAGPYLYPEIVSAPIEMTSSKGNGAIPLAEHAFMLMLMLDRQAERWAEAQREHAWRRHSHSELAGKTLGLLGIGHAGSSLARRAKAFDMTVIGTRRTPGAPAPDVDVTVPRDDLGDLLSRSDFLVVTAPLTAESAGMLGAAEFARMKPTAFYICVSRGGIADDDALLAALRTGVIAGAGLDAHAHEPLPPDSPFWTAPHTIVTPHNGATTPATAARGFDIFVDNLARFVDGRGLRNVVDRAAGY
jgi:phosphoglycerate dehydrogenase-like enzyme